MINEHENVVLTNDVPSAFSAVQAILPSAVAVAVLASFASLRLFVFAVATFHILLSTFHVAVAVAVTQNS